MATGSADHSPWVLFAVLSAVDALLFAGNGLHVQAVESADTASPFAGPAWDGDRDASWIEAFGYLQGLAAAVVLCAVWWYRRAGVHLVWALVLVAVVADDSLQLHERGGAWLVEAWDLPGAANLRPQDLGELAVWGLLAAILGPALLIAHLRARGTDRRGSWLLAGVVAVLVTFAVVVDMVAIAVKPALSAAGATALIEVETAGELTAMTLFLFAASRLLVRARHARGVRPPVPVLALRATYLPGLREGAAHHCDCQSGASQPSKT